MKKMIAAYIISSILFFGCLFYLIDEGVNEIKEVGLKNILTEIWEGSDK